MTPVPTTRSARRWTSLRSATLCLLVLASAGCSTALGVDDPITNSVEEIEVDGISFTASSSVSGKTVTVTLLAQNQGQTAAETTILGGNCRIMIRLYDSARGTDEWNEYAEVDACQEPAQVISLEPGGQETLSHSAEVDVDSGTYLATGTFQHLNSVAPRFLELVAGNVTIN